MEAIKAKTENSLVKAIKRWRTANRTLDRFLMVVLVIVMLLGLYVIYDSLYMYGHDPANLSYFFDNGNENWDEMPEDAVGWLTIYDTNINYAVMQGEDNEEYLNKNEYGEFALIGSIFLDFRNDPNWKDNYNLLYGHHMSQNRMFGSLDYFMDREYFNNHLKGSLKTRGADYDLDIFAVIVDTAQNQIFFGAGDEARTNELIPYLKKNALIYTEPNGDKYLSMTTCQTTGGTDRLIVLATMHVQKEPGTLYDENNLIEPKEAGHKVPEPKGTD